MHQPEWHGSYNENLAEWIAYWNWIRSRRFHAPPEDKGIPVPRTGRRKSHSRKDSGKAGVIGSSRVLPHRYMDEGDKGAAHNRHIKRVERAQWLSEAMEDSTSEEAYDTAEWFGSVYVWWEVDDYDESPYGDDYCETCHGPCEL